MAPPTYAETVVIALTTVSALQPEGLPSFPVSTIQPLILIVK